MGIFDSLFGIDSARENIQQGARNARGELTTGYGDVSSLLQPYTSGGRDAYGRLLRLSGAQGPGAQTEAFGDFRESPDYQFRLQQGGQAVDRSAAAKGSLMSGGTLKALTNYGQGAASQEYGNYFDRLYKTMLPGFQATGQQAGIRGDFAKTGAGIEMDVGKNMANADLAGGNMMMGGLGSLAKLAGFFL